jgi:hypothetical protein
MRRRRVLRMVSTREHEVRITMKWVTGAVAALAFVTGFVSATSTHADHSDRIFPTGETNWTCEDLVNKNCKTDNTEFTLFVESSLHQFGEQMVETVVTENISPTDLNPDFESSGTYSGGSETDVIVQAYSNAASPGTVWCDDAVSSTQCDQHYMLFNTDLPAYMLTCHEVGHTVGLLHSDQSDPTLQVNDPPMGCMGTYSTVISSHDQALLNIDY